MALRATPFIWGAAAVAGAVGVVVLASPSARRAIRDARNEVSDQLQGRTVRDAETRGLDLSGVIVSLGASSGLGRYTIAGKVAPASALEFSLRYEAGRLSIAYGHDILALTKGPHRALKDVERRSLRVALAKYGVTPGSQALLQALGDRREVWPSQGPLLPGEEMAGSMRSREEPLDQETRVAQSRRYLDTLEV